MQSEIILAHLKANPDRTQAQLVEATGYSIATISRMLYMLAIIGRECHISSWVRPSGNQGGRWKALYRAGPGYNMPYPRPSRMAGYCKAFRNRKLA